MKALFLPDWRLKKLSSEKINAMAKLEENGAIVSKGGNQLLCLLNQLIVPVETDAKVKLEENGFCVFTEFLDTAELEKVEQNPAR